MHRENSTSIQKHNFANGEQLISVFKQEHVLESEV